MPPDHHARRLLPAAAAMLLLLGSVSAPVLARDISIDTGGMGSPLKNASQRIGDVVLQALALAGLQYRYGGDSAITGMDCSALVQHVYRQAWQQELPRTAEEISRAGERVTRGELEPGDLVMFDTLSRPYSHVGIYLGEDKFVHSPSAGSRVRVENMAGTYWKTRYNGARRIADITGLERPR
ncbi:MAG: NlpC/P60 family protein [Lacisediminimonas sp.]|nr:NlpC/P60 family protein [Lacisediminimonas sp.]